MFPPQTQKVRESSNSDHLHTMSSGVERVYAGGGGGNPEDSTLQICIAHTNNHHLHEDTAGASLNRALFETLLETYAMVL